MEEKTFGDRCREVWHRIATNPEVRKGVIMIAAGLTGLLIASLTGSDDQKPASEP